VLGVGQVARHTFLMDWTRTRAFATTPTSNGIYITRPSAEATGVAADEYIAYRSRLIDELSQVRDPATGALAIERIWTREEAFSGPFLENAPDLTLVLRDGGLVSILPGDEVFTSRPAVAGTHRPTGIFAVRGPGVRHGGVIDELSILDVAPLVLHSLGLPVPEDMEGRVPEEVFDAGALRRRPVRTAPAVQGAPELVAVNAALDPDQEAIVMNRLRDLGYID
jgi:predicted AlkP superfamily phosphohydrolase/phosphomutase